MDHGANRGPHQPGLAVFVTTVFQDTGFIGPLRMGAACYFFYCKKIHCYPYNIIKENV